MLLLLLTLVVYLPLSVLRGTRTLFGWDYTLLHVRRLQFLRDAVLRHHFLPGWYPREMLGAPFSANLQSCPWIPTHWALLLFQPEDAYAAGVALAAALAALFTYLYCRRAGLSAIASMCAGWTFAAAGFFAVRVITGQLSTLEAYPSLPLLLWLADRALDPRRAASQRLDLAAMAIATAVVVTAGHPQIPAYSVGAALLYIGWRARGRLRFRLWGATLLGVGASWIAWWPMLLLIRRSTRALPLDPSPNDIPLPLHRLLGLIAPGIDGWPAGMKLAVDHPFRGYPHPSYFWDTFAYVGVLPVVAAAVLLAMCVVQRRRPASRWMFLGVIGVLAVLAAVPWMDQLRALPSVTILRSPARLLYLTTFALSVAAGLGLDALLAWKPAGRTVLVRMGVVACLAWHAWDLGHITGQFVLPTTWNVADVPELRQALLREGGNARVAADRLLLLRPLLDRDDAGGYDSILLADTYRAVLALTGAAPRSNEELIDASVWPVPALEAAGVRFVITRGTRPDLELAISSADLRMYRVAHPAPRASVDYQRPSSDQILLRSSQPQPGVIHVLESYSPGWTADVDGIPALVSKASGFAMAIPVPAGEHAIRLQYHTPGRRTGAVVSALSLGLLAALLVWNKSGRDT